MKDGDSCQGVIALMEDLRSGTFYPAQCSIHLLSQKCRVPARRGSDISNMLLEGLSHPRELYLLAGAAEPTK